MNRKLFSLFAMLLVQFSSAQKIDIRGIVSDSASGERIPYATVTIIGTNRGAVTNNNGFYLIANVPVGKYQITAISLGYQSVAKTADVVGKEFLTINFALSSKPVEVEEVVVTGGEKIELQEINTSVHILDQKELQKVPSAAQEDLFRSIQIIPGVVSSADVSSKFYVRGGAGDQNLIYFDGMKIHNPFHAFGIFSIFDPDIIKTTEVYTGAFPAGYGGRLSSVINITSRDGSTTGVHGGVAANFISGKVHLEGPLPDNNSWIVSARKSLFNDTFKKFLQNPVPISFYDVYAKANIGGTEFGRYSLQTFLSADDIVSPNVTEPDHRFRSESFAWTISDLVEDRVYIDAVVHASNFSIVRDAKQSTIVHSAESKISEGGLRGEMTVYTESRDLYFIGFEMNIPRYRYSFTNSSDVHVDINDISPEMWGWLRYQYITESWKLDLGFHSDIISLFNNGRLKTTLQPRLNVSYAIDPEWRIKFSYGMFSQNLVTLTNEDDIISLFEAWTFIPKDLGPETASHYILGVGGDIFSELSVDVQTYFKDYTSLMLYNKDKKFFRDPDYINGKGSSYGIETLFRYKYSFLDLYVAYTLGWTSVTINDFKYSPRYDRRHTVNILNTARITENIDLGLRWEIASGYPFSQTIGFYDRLSIPGLGRDSFITDEGKPYTILGEKNASRLPAYHRLDITLTYKYQFSMFTGNIGLSFVNIYNSKNILYYDRKTLQSITMLPFLPSAFAKIEF